jgi:VWFA-related protein
MTLVDARVLLYPDDPRGGTHSVRQANTDRHRTGWRPSGKCGGACASVALAIALVAPEGSAQLRTQPFRTETRLAHLSVVVHDRAGRPIDDLVAADFRVTENGTPQTIAHFARVTDPRTPARASLSGTTFTNVVDGRAGTGATIVLFDQVNTPRLHQIEARHALLRFLQELGPDDRIGFYVIESDRVRILHDFTRDASSLLSALRAAPGGSAAPVDAPPPAPPARGAAEPAEDSTRTGMRERLALDDWLARPDPVEQIVFRERVKATVAAFEAVAQRLAGVSGRKNVIWVSGGLPIDFAGITSLRDMDDDVRRATRALSHADVAIYPVDATGLATDAAYGADRVRPSGRSRPIFPAFDTAQRLAEQTGGRAYRHTNDLRAAMQRALADAEMTYVLGYYPADERWNGAFRRIAVNVGRPGAHVRHRSGYFAHPPRARDPEIRNTGLVEAMAHPIEATELAVSVDFEPLEDGRFSVAMRVDPGTVALERKGDRWTGALEFAIAQRHRDGRLSSAVHVSAPIDFTEEVHRRFVATGVTVTRTIPLPDDAVQVVVGARDLLSGAVGTVIVDVDRLPGRQSAARRD